MRDSIVFAQRWVLCVLLLFAAGFGAIGSRGAPDATTGISDFEQANGLYAQGKFADAASAYEKQVGRGEYTANLFYNLANAYFRLGDRGRAILNYRRALILQPSNNEAAANLRFVRGKDHGDLDGRRSDPGWLEMGAALLTASTWTYVAAISGWLGVAILLAALLRRRARGFGGSLLAAACFVICAAAVGAIFVLGAGAAAPSSIGVVVGNDAHALYSPADNSKVVATLPVGDEVDVLSSNGAWIYVQLGDGTRGWMPTDKIETMVPARAF